MAATSLPRTDDSDAPLSNVKTYDDGASGPHSQAMVLEDETQAPISDTNALPVALRDTSNAPFGTAGNPVNVQSAAGTLWEHDTVGTAVNGALLRAGSGSLSELRVLLDPSVVNVRYLLLYDTATLPVGGAVPKWRGLIPPAGQMSESIPVGKFPFTTGCYAMVSTSVDTLTISGAEAFFHARGEQ